MVSLVGKERHLKLALEQERKVGIETNWLEAWLRFESNMYLFGDVLAVYM